MHVPRARIVGRLLPSTIFHTGNNGSVWSIVVLTCKIQQVADSVDVGKTTECALLFCVRTSWVKCSARWERSSAPLAAGWNGHCRKLKMPGNIVWWGFGWWKISIYNIGGLRQQIGSRRLFNNGAYEGNMEFHVSPKPKCPSYSIYE